MIYNYMGVNYMDNNMQLSELRQIAKDKGLKNISKLKKDELIKLLEGIKEDKPVDDINLIEEKTEKDEKDKFVSGNRSI